MESPQRQVAAVEYPRWTGDFTLPRLRAKLANKHLLHPDVEPEYLEIYRSDLSQMSIVRSPGGSQDALNSTWAPGSMKTGSRSQVVAGGGKNWHLTRDPSAATIPMWRTAMAEQRHVTRVSSVPALGVRRNERAPAGLWMLPPDTTQSAQSLTQMQSMARTASGVKISPSGIPISPSADERREIDKERNVRNASKKMWSAAHGEEMRIKCFLEQLGEDEPELTAAQVLSRLRSEGFPGIKKPMKEGANVNWRNPEWDGASLLIKAVRTERKPIVLAMLALGADHAATDDSGRGVLHWAALEGIADLVQYFLENLPDNYGTESVNLPDNGGDCALHLAAYRGHLPVVRQLVINGADPTLENEGGHTPIDLARAARMWSVVSYLEEASQQDEDRKRKKDEIKLNELFRPCDLKRWGEVREELGPVKPKVPDKGKKK